MRTVRFGRWAAALLALTFPASAGAADAEVAEQLRAMQERLGALEQTVESQRDELEHAQERIETQKALLERQQLADVAAGGGEPSFLDTIEIGGWLSASYFYNFNDPDGRALGGANQGAAGAFYPFRPDANSFSLDQAWIEVERPVSPEQRAGFRLDFVYGKHAGLLSGDFGAGDGFSGNDFELYQAYVQYLAPIGEEGVTFQFGKFATVIGAEVVQAPYNFNITRGHVYNLFQPITHSGLLASTSLAGFDVKLGVVNETRSFPAADIDLNKDKAVLWSIGGALGETVSWSFNGAHGSSDSGLGFDAPAGDKETILDLIVGFDPNEKFSSYVNADYIKTQNSRGDDVSGWGVAVAGRYALTDRMGLAGRAEYATVDDFFGGGSDLSVWGVTGTVDYALTERLMVRGELRYDRVSDGGDLFIDDDSFAVGVADFDQEDQVTAGVEVIYQF